MRHRSLSSSSLGKRLRALKKNVFNWREVGRVEAWERGFERGEGRGDEEGGCWSGEGEEVSGVWGGEGVYG